MTVLILLVLVAASLGQEVERDPCEPNPCGENTRCQAVFIRGNPVISCDCLPNYKYPVGGDSSDGCVEDSSPSSVAIPVGGTPARTRDEPRAIEDSGRRLQDGVRPAQLVPRVPLTKSRVEKDHVDVDTPDLFPDECLIHEDCDQDKYCSPAPALKCVNACTLPVCGDHALCSAALHRPVCACEDGYEGNPYDRCTKMPSRVGMRFRKK